MPFNWRFILKWGKYVTMTWFYCMYMKLTYILYCLAQKVKSVHWCMSSEYCIHILALLHTYSVLVYLGSWCLCHQELLYWMWSPPVIWNSRYNDICTMFRPSKTASIHLWYHSLLRQWDLILKMCFFSCNMELLIKWYLYNIPSIKQQYVSWI